MTENKRFEIKPSAMYNNKYVIHDSEKEYSFPILDSTLNYMFCKAMNELNDENTHIKNTIKEMYETERTALGRSVLKQLLEAIQWK